MSARRAIRPVARSHTIPAPTGGWNASSALDDMPPDQAETLINWFPETTFARLRRGYAAFCDTASGQPVKALMEYTGGTTTALLAATDRELLEVSSGTPILLDAGFSSDAWVGVNYSTGGGNYLVTVNGAETTAYVFDGTNLTSASNTVGGVASSVIFSRVESYNSRIFFAEADTLSLWYLPVQQFQGALTELDLGPLCVRGGSIASIATWTRDNAAAGANEMFVIVTTKGEVLIYSGPDPATWTLSARFLVGEPVSGPRAVVKLGPDCVLLCEDGFQPMATYLQLGQSKASAIALSARIGNAVTQAIRDYKAEDGWAGVLYPRANMLVFNVPRGSGTFFQYVVNTVTGAWCQFQGMNAYCWSLMEADLYFGAADGVIYKADTGTDDDGAAINGEWRGSYQYVGSPGMIKRFTMARPIFQTTGPVLTSFGVDVDFVNTDIVAASLSTVSGSVWGTGVWGFATWGSGYQLQRNWVGVAGIGYAVAPHMKVQTSTIAMNLMSTEMLWESGGWV